MPDRDFSFSVRFSGPIRYDQSTGFLSHEQSSGVPAII
jgi:hypothetical protein